MSTAPVALMNARDYIIKHLGVPANAVGIVGDNAHSGGYHVGSDRVVQNDYSVVESKRDKLGLSSYASALDIGQFQKQNMNLRDLSLWLVEQCKKNTDDTRNIREVIYSPDGKTVKRWDREKRRTSGDDSHLWHTHISIYRDASNAPLTRLFERYIKERTGPKVDWKDDVVKNPRQRHDSKTNPSVQVLYFYGDLYQKVYDLTDKVDALTAKVSTPVTYVQLTDAQFDKLVDRLADDASH